mmetsp:Transcript_34418/g.78082  ORF Transcript_34418/g.78082 Transcript_34418/m.78082 type:complete len:354 (+) Transcript_34418:477-1538(+)
MLEGAVPRPHDVPAPGQPARAAAEPAAHGGTAQPRRVVARAEVRQGQDGVRPRVRVSPGRRRVRAQPARGPQVCLRGAAGQRHRVQAGHAGRRDDLQGRQHGRELRGRPPRRHALPLHRPGGRQGQAGGHRPAAERAPRQGVHRHLSPDAAPGGAVPLGGPAPRGHPGAREVPRGPGASAGAAVGEQAGGAGREATGAAAPGGSGAPAGGAGPAGGGHRPRRGGALRGSQQGDGREGHPRPRAGVAAGPREGLGGRGQGVAAARRDGGRAEDDRSEHQRAAVPGHLRRAREVQDGDQGAPGPAARADRPAGHGQGAARRRRDSERLAHLRVDVAAARPRAHAPDARRRPHAAA